MKLGMELDTLLRQILERLDKIEARLPPVVISRKEAAQLVGCSVRTIDRELDRGTYREVRAPGSKRRRVDATSIKSTNLVEELAKLRKLGADT